MNFQKSVHWHEGLLLRPQHLQIMQDSLAKDRHESRALTLPYPYGIIEAKLSSEALTRNIIEFDTLHAIMPGGMEIIAHVNAHLTSLNLQNTEALSEGTLTVCLAIPRISKSARNIVDKDEAIVKSRYIADEEIHVDQNTGSDSHIVSMRMINARLVLDTDDHTDMEILPVLRLSSVSDEDGSVTLNISDNYIPPAIKVEGSQTLSRKLQALSTELENAHEVLSSDFVHSGYSNEEFTGLHFEKILKLRSFNTRAPELVNLRKANVHPFQIYLCLTNLLGELSALNPTNSYQFPPEYNHNDLHNVFTPVINQLLSLISKNDRGRYTKIEFTKDNQRDAWTTILEDHHFVTAKEYYFAVQTRESHQKLIEAIQTGDQFKLVPSSMSRARIRGVNMVEDRFPPAILPSLPNVIWFRIVTSESSTSWDRVRREKSLSVVWPEKQFPNITIALYATLTEEVATNETK